MIHFEVCPNFPTLLCNYPEFFFPELFSKTITNKTKKESRIAIVRILSFSLVSSYKNTLYVPSVKKIN
jgi:hypothetical protein